MSDPPPRRWFIDVPLRYHECFDADCMLYRAFLLLKRNRGETPEVPKSLKSSGVSSPLFIHFFGSFLRGQSTERRPEGGYGIKPNIFIFSGTALRLRNAMNIKSPSHSRRSPSQCRPKRLLGVLSERCALQSVIEIHNPTTKCVFSCGRASL